MRRRKLSGFTLVELLVVITIIAMLMAIVLPAANQVIETVRRARCGTNLKDLSFATASYVQSNSRYPGLINELKPPGTASGSRGMMVTWVVELLPYMQQKGIYDQWKLGRAEITPINQLVCPTDPAEATDLQKLSYVANAGSNRDLSATTPNIANGVFFNRWKNPKLKVRSANMKKPAYTLLLVENIQARNWANKQSGTGRSSGDTNYTEAEALAWTGFCWGRSASSVFEWNVGGHDPKYAQFGPVSVRYARPSSLHDAGANAAFAGGGVRFISDGVAHHVYVHLMISDRDRADIGRSGVLAQYQLSDQDY